MLATAPETDTVAAATWHDRWIVMRGPAAHDRADRTWRAASGTVLSVASLTGSDLSVAEDRDYVVLVGGLLTNARELDPRHDARTFADLALRELRRRGTAFLADLRGVFALIVFDKQSGALSVARDHIGHAAVFHANDAARWWFATSPDVLASEPGISRELNAVVLAEWLLGWYSEPEATAYAAIRRVPQATLMTIGADGAVSSRRYWDPVPDDEPIDWLGDEHLDEFDALLTQSVRRSVGSVDGDAGVFLSGGLDSIAVALAASDASKESGRRPPLGLSLLFPAGPANEGAIQEGVASALGMPQVLAPFDDAVGPEGLVAEALALTKGWSQPMWNIWTPGYMHLAAQGASRGVRLVMTGRGGDEWLTNNPLLMADQLASGDLSGLWRVLAVKRQSNQRLTAIQMARRLWYFAARPVASAVFDRMAPGPWHRRRRRRLLSERPAWVAPDPAVRQAMDDRIEGWIHPARPVHGFYVYQLKLALRHPSIGHDMEEIQELGRRNGQRVLHPFWDVDLVSLLYRMHPDALMGKGREWKWPLRRRVAPRLPNLGLEQRGKVNASEVFVDSIRRQSQAAWERLGGPATLAKLGVADPAVVQSGGLSTSSLAKNAGAAREWILLNLETWARPRS